MVKRFTDKGPSPIAPAKAMTPFWFETIQECTNLCGLCALARESWSLPCLISPRLGLARIGVTIIVDGKWLFDQFYDHYSVDNGDLIDYKCSHLWGFGRFKMQHVRSYSKYAREAASLLGKQIKLGRKQRKWTEHELADRAGIARATLQKIEKGDLSCAIGLVFEVASLVGVRLFETDTSSLAMQQDRMDDKLALLPKAVRKSRKTVDDDF